LEILAIVVAIPVVAVVAVLFMKRRMH
jgi:hypothetical protein